MKTAPAFWWQPGLSLRAALLAPAALVYGAIAGRRMLARPAYESRLPVVCIGNFTVGGTGKTPFALRLAALLQAGGHRPVFLLRGYGGRERGPLRVDPDHHTSGQVGDEAFLLARAAPTIVAADRAAGARLAETLDADLILMDDGFQNPALHKDLTFALVDAAVGTGNGFVLPAGPLRAPLGSQILRADALVVVGEGDRADPVIHRAARRALPVLRARIEPEDTRRFEGLPVLAYAGIGRPEKFFDTLRRLGADLRETRSFADHHAFREDEARDLITRAEAAGLQLVTTAKDMARIEASDGEIFHWLAKESDVLRVTLAVEPEDRLQQLVADALRRRAFRA
ncbi:tetraacyldisaccharide 4'-kinase [Pannonibacter tanglangensis]|uniref:Tetraacyldisaccharide 4'-kinase n=1 Tax=Pannonibacter tanglangensis TaxID=2750084 RepID=A0ABW9ZHV3_9HYPH|nr:tetraacyldisaccharide 4'-kinase [Pannonibacter sp. XCT-34]NBN64444.1 tetraacyldisaccharide 4'-kinase [Pannonibacter sp. XCT-34]